MSAAIGDQTAGQAPRERLRGVVGGLDCRPEPHAAAAASPPLRCVTNPLSRFARHGRPHYRLLAGFHRRVSGADAAFAFCGAP